ncbi:MAG TPA: YXWGXW repeat-containing protein, partial [Stellaceae bacterium]|nr:YXWGXW repeat-containing protein [Stellaceae bacterium]
MRLLRAFIPVLLLLAIPAAPSPSKAAVSIGISVGIAPPPLPIYEQPLIPGPGYLWTPGYWAWGPEGYYW